MVFSPAFVHDGLPVDTALLSSDQILFFAHRHVLLASSNNKFADLLSSHTAEQSYARGISFPQARHSADVLNMVLHIAYALPPHAYVLSFDGLSIVAYALKAYGMDPISVFARGTHLYELVLTVAPVLPMEAYAFAAEHGLEELAVAVSPYTLSCKIHQISPALVDQIGLKYLHRLQVLHGMRMETLKNLLDVRLYPHVPVPDCTPMQRRVVGRAYELAAAQIFCAATPGASDVCGL